VAKTIFVALSVAIAVAVASAVVVAALFSRPAGPPAARVKLNWDLSAGRDVLTVGWPLGVNETVWQVDGPGELRIKLPDGRQGTFTFAGIEVRQEGGKVRNIRVFAAAEQLDGAHAHAHALLDGWGQDGRESLDKWYEKRRVDGMGYRDPDGKNWLSESPKGELYPRYGVAVLTTHRSEEPWCVEWAVGLAKPAPVVLAH
jgi:hypothetical protein